MYLLSSGWPGSPPTLTLFVVVRPAPLLCPPHLTCSSVSRFLAQPCRSLPCCSTPPPNFWGALLLLSLGDLFGSSEPSLMTPLQMNSSSLKLLKSESSYRSLNMNLIRLASALRGQGAGQGFSWGSLGTRAWSLCVVGSHRDLF